MAPSAIQSSPETTSELINSGVKHTVAETAPSIAVNGSHSILQELDANKLVVIRSLNPRPIPEPGSPEVWAQNMYRNNPLPRRLIGATASKTQANKEAIVAPTI
jgi:hypothetical protein